MSERGRMVKVMVVYYSFEGHTRQLAQAIAESVEGDILELRPEKEIKTHGFMKYVWGGKQVVMNEKPKLLPLVQNPQDYDFLFIGTPVWAFSYAPPLARFFSDCDFKDKKVALFCSHGGGKGNVFEKMENNLKGNQVVSAMDFKETNMEENLGKT